MQHVEVTRVIDAPVQAVWDRYTDHVSWTDWAGLGRARIEREGVPAPNGVGCVRAISNTGITVYEEILTFDAPRSMTYTVVRGGIPIKEHLGEVTFEEEGAGTRVTWRCRFRSKIPGMGPVFRWLVTRLFRNALDGLAREPLGASR